MVNNYSKFKIKINPNLKIIRLKVQLHKVQETIKPILHAEDVIEKHSTDNTKDVGHADTPKPK
jgi:hypothetical protein